MIAYPFHINNCWGFYACIDLPSTFPEDDVSRTLPHYPELHNQQQWWRRKIHIDSSFSNKYDGRQILVEIFENENSLPVLLTV